MWHIIDFKILLIDHIMINTKQVLTKKKTYIYVYVLNRGPNGCLFSKAKAS